MTPLQIASELEEALYKIDSCVNSCFDLEVDCTFLSLAKNALTSQIAGIKQTLAYKMDRYETYGEPLDEIGVESLRAMIDEIGYDHVREIFGEDVDSVLSEATAEGEIYRV